MKPSLKDNTELTPLQDLILRIVRASSDRGISRKNIGDMVDLIAQEANKGQRELIRTRADLAYAAGVIEGLTGEPNKYLAKHYPELTADKDITT